MVYSILQMVPVSIHAPVRVRPGKVSTGALSYEVSIHAPVRVRLAITNLPKSSNMFQSTHP